MRLAIVSTYPPRPCGIGIFSQDLRSAMLAVDPSVAVDVVSIVRDPVREDPPEVVAVIRQDVRSDYAAAARVLTSRGTDVVVIEHEYGIFGGECGEFVLSLAEEVEQPLVVTLHTVLSAPSVRQAEVLRALCHRASLVTVFTETARRMVVDARIVPPERIRVLPHGAPSVLLGARSGADVADEHLPRPALERLEDRTVLSTFGLISAGKGLELAISALPAIVAAHPEVLYLIAGQTHPEVVKHEGESYRLRLERLVRDLGLTEHVHFLDRFLTEAELAVLLGSTDLYVTPYRSREQIVSGALTFAVAAGCPVVSTPYYYAEDLLSSGAGVLVPFEDPAALTDAVLDLLDHPDKLERAGAEARRVGAALVWPSVAAATIGVLNEALALGPVGTDRIAPGLSSPRVRPDHLLDLVDDVGIIQHADGVVPNRASGYCVDDVARLVIVALGLDHELIDRGYRRVLTAGLAFLQHAWDSSTIGMHNLMGYDRRWIDDAHSGDHLGRTAWALGEVVAALPALPQSASSLRLLQQLVPMLESSHSPRVAAFTVLGLSRLNAETLSEPLEKLLRMSASRLLTCYRETRTDNWRWFEDTLSYDNARLPQALIAAGHRLNDPELVGAGIEALDWYGEQVKLHSPCVRLVGNRWRRRGESAAIPAEGDEQPLDAAALVEALVEAFHATGRGAYASQAVRAFEWFLGLNRLGIAVYDFTSGGCHDGLGSESLNENEGAESTLSFLQALLALNGAGLQSSLPTP